LELKDTNATQTLALFITMDQINCQSDLIFISFRATFTRFRIVLYIHIIILKGLKCY